MYADNTATFLDNKKIKLNKYTEIQNCIGSISTKYWDEAKKTKLLGIKDKFRNINSYGSIGCEYFDIALGKRDFALLSREGNYIKTFLKVLGNNNGPTRFLSTDTIRFSAYLKSEVIVDINSDE